MLTSDRFALFMLAGMLSACSSANEREGDAGETVQCRIGGATGFAPTCRIEWMHSQPDGTREFVIHRQDGGFRRFTLSQDRSRIEAADGAEPVIVQKQGDASIMLMIGAEAYHLGEGQLKR